MHDTKPWFSLAWKALLAWSILTSLSLDSRGANFYQGVAPTNLPWPGGIIPYVFTTNVSPAEQTVYLAGMKEWELAANIHFVPLTTQSSYVILDLDYLQGTNTYYGSVPPVMTIDNLSRSQVCHETGHLLGFQHEHVRIDRDDYITVNFDNISGGSTNGSGEGSGDVTSLYLIDSNSTPNGPYDFQSVMHYGRTLFSIDPTTLDVLAPNPPYLYKYYNRIGNAALSVGDFAGAAYLYGPPTTPLTNIVTTTADIGPGSLRAAIYYANNNPGTTVTFNIPTNDPGYSNGVFTIYVNGQLPPLVGDGTVIDATTQPGYAGTPLIALDASQVIPEVEFSIGGLYLYQRQCVLRGLAFANFSDSGINLLYNESQSNQVQACFIGLSPNGANAAPNQHEGINIGVGARSNIIGGASASQRNVISGNAGYGITITGTNSDGNVVMGNYIGLDPTGTEVVSNALSGIGIWGGSSGDIVSANNLISGNGEYGVLISDPTTTGTIVQNNYMGVDVSGAVPLGNLYGGIGVFSGANTVTVTSNVLSANGNAGLWLDGPGVMNNVVLGNVIGASADATLALGNGWTGVYLLDGASGNFIGSNVLSGNVSEGIFISDPGTESNVVQGNFIGSAPDGFTALPNGYTGVGLWNGAANNLIGGTNQGQANLISGNYSDGISIGDPGTSYNVVEGNYIGVAIDGVTPLPNDYVGVYIVDGPETNYIGGTINGARNIISGNTSDGLQFFQATNNIVQGNFVGTAKDGLTAVPNGEMGFYLYESEGNLIGSNVFSGNVEGGIQLFGPDAGNLIQGNDVGVGIDGTTPLGNGWQGIIIQSNSANNVIDGNVIADNGEEGIIIFDPGSIGNSIRGNSIFGNTNLGINLAGGVEDYFGVTANHSGGPETGPNNLQNYPVLSNAIVSAYSTVLTGTLNSAPNQSFFIDIYSDSQADASGHGQGQTYAGSTVLQTDANGNGSFSISLIGAFAGQFLTATATDPLGDTSEFSLDLGATNTVSAPPSPTPGVFSGPYHWNSNGFSFSLTLTTNQTYTLQMTTNLSTTPILWTNLIQIVATNSPMQIVDPTATNSPTRFYRAIAP